MPITDLGMTNFLPHPPTDRITCTNTIEGAPTMTTTDDRDLTRITDDDVAAQRRDIALLKAREAARVHDTVTDSVPQRDCRTALLDGIAEALNCGATMAQVIEVLAGASQRTVVVERADVHRLRRILGDIPAGGVLPFRRDDDTLPDLLNSLEAAIAANRQAMDAYELDRQTLATMRRDVAGMRRLFSLDLPPGT